MTDEEVEIVAQELAKAGGTSWYPGRQTGALLRVVTDRYRNQARAAIAAFDRLQRDETGFVNLPLARRPPNTGYSDQPQG